MKRDMDLIRAVTLRIENAVDYIDSSDLEFDGYSSAVIAYHVLLMNETQLIKCIDITTSESEFYECRILRLTAKGHDFADAARNDGVWNFTISKVKEKLGGVSLDLMITLLKKHAAEVLGINLG